LAGFDAVSLGDKALDDAAWDLETHLGVGHLDVARKNEVSGARTTAI